MSKKILGILAIALMFLIPSTGFSQSHPLCQRSDSDSDGDGWGWENNRSCIVPVITVDSCNSNSNVVCIDPIEPEDNGVDPTTDPLNCDYSNASQHNGWGWNNKEKVSCKPRQDPVDANTGETENPQNLPDGNCSYQDADQNNGWGWNAVDRVACPPFNTGALDFNFPNKEDVIYLLIAGQSNSLGEGTSYSSSLDAVNDKVAAFTSDNGWQIADLCTQIWDNKWYPKNGGNCSNHPAFQFANEVQKLNPDKHVMFVTDGHAGQPLSKWHPSNFAYKSMDMEMTMASEKLEGKKLDGILFAQGESDEGNTNWYSQLNDFIQNVRNENWTDEDTMFIVPETHKSTYINSQIRRLGTDGDSLTEYVDTSSLQTKDGTHWNSSALRAIGKFAARLLQDKIEN